MNDVRLSLRMLRKSPGFTIAAVLTLALAIGANAVVFSVMNALIIRPLNVPRPQSLYALWRPQVSDAHQSYPDYLDLRDRNHSFEDLAAFNMSAAGLDTGRDPAPIWLYETSGNYFDALGLKPYLGRFFHRSDEHGPNSAPYIVLSYEKLADALSSGSECRGPGGSAEPASLHHPRRGAAGVPRNDAVLLPDLFVPMVNDEQVDGQDFLNLRGNRWVFMVLGHLKPGVTPAQAGADLSLIGSYLEKTYPKDDGKMTFSLVRPGLYGDYLGRPVKEFMTALMLLAGLILLAACANLGSLFAARAADRSREVALRLALGSTRKRILRQLFTEALLISLIGGALGLMGSVMLLHGLSAWQPMPQYPIHLAVNPDANVYAVALLLTLASGFLFGAVPVRQVLHTNPYEVVKVGSTRRVGRRISVRDMLLVVQIAICAVLVTSSMVAVRGLVRSLHNDFGFAMQDTLLVDTDLGMAGYAGDRVPPMQKRTIDALSAIPGVESVGLADGLPLVEGADDSSVFTDKTVDLRPTNAVGYANLFIVSPEYLRAAGTRLLAGRMFTWHDDKDSPRIAIVNQEFARRFFGSAERRDRPVFQAAGRNAHPGGGHRRRREIWQPHRRSTAGHVSAHPAIADRKDVAGGALQPRSSATDGSHKEHAA